MRSQIWPHRFKRPSCNLQLVPSCLRTLQSTRYPRRHGGGSQVAVLAVSIHQETARDRQMGDDFFSGRWPRQNHPKQGHFHSRNHFHRSSPQHAHANPLRLGWHCQPGWCTCGTRQSGLPGMWGYHSMGVSEPGAWGLVGHGRADMRHWGPGCACWMGIGPMGHGCWWSVQDGCMLLHGPHCCGYCSPPPFPSLASWAR